VSEVLVRAAGETGVGVAFTALFDTVAVLVAALTRLAVASPETVRTRLFTHAVLPTLSYLGISKYQRCLIMSKYKLGFTF
jgi:hypothetical protein